MPRLLISIVLSSMLLLLALATPHSFGQSTTSTESPEASTDDEGNSERTDASFEEDQVPIADQEPSADEVPIADQEPSAESAPPPSEPEPEEAEQPPINPDATFTPTEEISEDKPVAFPVDI